MKENTPRRKLYFGLLVSVLIGGTLGAFNNSALFMRSASATWSCPTSDPFKDGSCIAMGCGRYSGGGMVCSYAGQDCPPLNRCEDKDGPAGEEGGS